MIFFCTVWKVPCYLTIGIDKSTYLCNYSVDCLLLVILLNCLYFVGIFYVYGYYVICCSCFLCISSTIVITFCFIFIFLCAVCCCEWVCVWFLFFFFFFFFFIYFQDLLPFVDFGRIIRTPHTFFRIFVPPTTSSSSSFLHHLPWNVELDSVSTRTKPSFFVFFFFFLIYLLLYAIFCSFSLFMFVIVIALYVYSVFYFKIN